mmetsp:Transcript_16947/g.41279  ORF Transcript_16947/g.41279 Transcript_16947/m.41279 type:complete len:139 (-) Transcript_16947:5190-5606(-)
MRLYFRGSKMLPLLHLKDTKATHHTLHCDHIPDECPVSDARCEAPPLRLYDNRIRLVVCELRSRLRRSNNRLQGHHTISEASISTLCYLASPPCLQNDRIASIPLIVTLLKPSTRHSLKEDGNFVTFHMLKLRSLESS